MKDEQIRDCVCQGTTFSQSAFSVGRALDTTHTTCGEGSQGITVTGVSDMFTSSVVNPVQYFVPYVAVNDDTGGARIFAQNDYYKPVLKLQEEDYAHKDPHHRAVLHLYFGVVDSNIAGLNGQAKDVKVQWIELPDSVPILEDINARYVGGLQMSECPEGGSVFPDIVREGIKCFQNSNCDDPTVTKQTVGKVCMHYFVFVCYFVQTISRSALPSCTHYYRLMVVLTASIPYVIAAASIRHSSSWSTV